MKNRKKIRDYGAFPSSDFIVIRDKLTASIELSGCCVEVKEKQMIRNLQKCVFIVTPQNDVSILLFYRVRRIYFNSIVFGWYLHSLAVSNSIHGFLRWHFPIDATIPSVIFAMPTIPIEWQKQSLLLRLVTLDREPIDAPIQYFRLRAIHFVSSANDFRCVDAEIDRWKIG